MVIITRWEVKSFRQPPGSQPSLHGLCLDMDMTTEDYYYWPTPMAIE